MTILKAMLCLTLLLGSKVVLAESPSEVDQLAARLSDHLRQNRITVEQGATRTERRTDGTSSIQIITPSFLTGTIGVFASDEDAEREYTKMKTKIQSFPLERDSSVAARNGNLLFLLLPFTEQQVEEAKAILNVFTKFSAHSPQDMSKNNRQAEQPKNETTAPQIPSIVLPQMVTIPGKNFEIGKYEVTQKEWVQVMGINPSEFPGCENCPVDNVSWNDVQKFLSRLNDITNRKYRLPTDSEWFFACNGGTNLLYCGSNDLATVGWATNDVRRTHPVGQKKGNTFGTYDMTGNVAEWTQDCCKDDCRSRTIRGGGWFTISDLSARAERQDCASPHISWNYFGFRLARSLP